MKLYETGNGNETYDTQMACYLTDYAMALVAGCCALYVVLARSKHHHPEITNVRRWYLVYFVLFALASLLGGIVHHCADQALRQVGEDSELQMVRVFGTSMTRSALDSRLRLLWRIILVTSIGTNLALFGLASEHYLRKHTRLVQSITTLAAVMIVVVAVIVPKMVVLAASLVPVVVFGIATSLTAAQSKNAGTAVQRRATNELVIYALTIAGAAVQALKMAPSTGSFNHNALAHVLLTFSELGLLHNYSLEVACHEEDQMVQTKRTLSTGLIGDE